MADYTTNNENLYTGWLPNVYTINSIKNGAWFAKILKDYIFKVVLQQDISLHNLIIVCLWHFCLMDTEFWKETLKSDPITFDAHVYMMLKILIQLKTKTLQFNSHSLLNNVLFHSFWPGSILHCSRPQKSPFHPWKREYVRLNWTQGLNLLY